MEDKFEISNKYKKHLKEGRGQGEGVDYIPWIKINEFSSKGRATRIMGIKTNRIHHLHSDNQLRVFLIFEWSDKVVDIRECYPLLDLMKVVDDKESLSLNKFVDKETGEQLVITTNFLITIKEADGTKGYIARAVKNCSELSRNITIEKLEIERRYWEAKNIDFKVITDKELNRQLCKNIQWVRETLLDSSEVVDVIKTTSELLYSTLLNNQEIVVKEVLKEFEKSNNLDKGIALYMFRYLLAVKKIKTDMTKSIDFNLRIRELVMFTEEG